MSAYQMRSYAGEDDYWRIREFLREVFRLNIGRELSWQAFRLDYTRWHIVANITHARWEETLFIWETPDGQMAGVLTPEEYGQIYLQLHPLLATPDLVDAMLATAEECLATANPDGGRRVRVWAGEQDALRRNALEQRGYSRRDYPEYQRHRSLAGPIPDGTLPPGYTVRSLGDGLELVERCWASGRGFHPDDMGAAIRNREDVTWYRNIQTAPLYRRDLDLVAIDPDGRVASFCTVWFDDVTRCGTFEPVATVPEHQRSGLGKAVLCEGLRRLRRMGATTAYVGSYEPAAHALYESVGFLEYDLCEPWVKEIGH